MNRICRKTLNWLDRLILAIVVRDDGIGLARFENHDDCYGARFIPEMRSAIIQAIDSQEISLPLAAVDKVAERAAFQVVMVIGLKRYWLIGLTTPRQLAGRIPCYRAYKNSLGLYLNTRVRKK